MRLFALILCVVSVCSSQPLPGSKDSPTESLFHAWQDLKDSTWSFRFLSALIRRDRAMSEVVKG
jgi:hypothetical protein